MAPAQSTKRKKTADADTASSPPKRVTRARANTKLHDTVVDKPEPKPRTTKITTASRKVAVEKAKKVATVPAKRKTRVDDEEVVEEEAPQENSPVVEERPKIEPRKPKARSKKAEPDVNQEVAKEDAPKTRGRPAKAAVEAPKVEAPKTRGRQKKTADPVAVEAAPEASEEPHKPEPVKKTTRERAAVPTKPTLATAVSKPAAPAPKKRVKFQKDTEDKENIPVETLAPRKSALKATGLTAKPLRKPAAARATTRGRKPTGLKAAKNQEMQKPMPLSPKKVNQIVRSDSIVSEDELAGEKTPIRALSKSPCKRIPSPIKDFGSIPKLDFGQSTAPASPSEPVCSTILASPPRKPPPSPFKDSLKSPPKKFNLGDNVTQTPLLPSRTPMKSSLLQKSPKRGILGESGMKPILLPSKSPFKASLLGTPARRMNASPTKTIANDDFTAGLRKYSPIKAPRFSPEKVISSPFRVAKSPEHVSGVQTIADDGRKANQADEEELTPDSASLGEEDELAEILPQAQSPGQDDQQPSETDEDSRIDDSKLVVQDRIVESESESEKRFMAPAFSIPAASLRRISMESELSEDELASPQKIHEISPMRTHGGTEHTSATNFSLTPLAEQFNTWVASSPNKKTGTGRPRQARGVFSLGGAELIAMQEQPASDKRNPSPAKTSFFEDEMVIRNDQDEDSDAEITFNEGQDLSVLKISQESQVSEEYGDENAEPCPAETIRAEQEASQHTLTCTPAKTISQHPREIHTVSKVPLRAYDDDSPLQVPRQRSRSFGNPLAPVDQYQFTRSEDVIVGQPATPVLAPATAVQTPSSGVRLDLETPGRTIRKGTMPNVLKGAVVYVDVHTTEGADASGIFVDLLTQMGARCVKQWSWNPRASMGSSLDGSASPQEQSPNISTSKPGITHVVYKDGGKRTLEKVRSSNGVVLCVGVGWVLDCERDNKWLDEADYAIDISLVPRGGGRRRKSMEPRALANLNGNLIPASETPAKSAASVDMSPTKEFLTFNTPASRRETFVIEHQLSDKQETAVQDPTNLQPTSIASPMDDDNILEDGSSWGSPTTPSYLKKGLDLIQRTCPPKQMVGKNTLFPLSGNIEDQPDETVRRRLMEARRKSMQFSSRIRSPLGRTVDYDQ